jgi:hypothetical protein
VQPSHKVVRASCIFSRKFKKCCLKVEVLIEAEFVSRDSAISESAQADATRSIDDFKIDQCSRLLDDKRAYNSVSKIVP